MYETRLRRLLVAFWVLLGVIGARAFALQVLDATDAAGRPWSSRVGGADDFVVYPRRGEILWADGSKMAWNVPSYGLEILWRRVDHRILPGLEEMRAAYPDGLTARNSEVLAAAERDLTHLGEKLLRPKPDSVLQTRWACTVCGTQRASRGPPDRSCRECGLHAFEQAAPVTPADLASLTGVRVHRVHLALVDALRRWRQNEHWRSHVLLPRVPESAVAAMDVHRDRFGGFLALPRNGRAFDPLARPITGGTRLPTEDEAQRLADAYENAKGVVRVQKETFYPTLTGTTMLEAVFDARLRGFHGRHERVRLPERDFEEEVRVVVPVDDGEDLHTTLRRDLQEMARGIVEAEAPAGGHGAAVVLDVRTGAVLALASTDRDAMDHARSHVIPGSVYKLVTAVALLEAGIAPDDVIRCRGEETLSGGRGRYNCHDTVHGEVALHRAIVCSCNGYFAQQAVAVGQEALSSAAERLGLRERPLKNVLGWPGTTAAGLEYSRPEKHPDRWRSWDLSQIGIGQGAASASPLQIAVAYARIASGGRRVEPFLLASEAPAPGSIAVDPALARWAPRLRAALRDVVLDEADGTAWKIAALHEVRAAGKTGTAEVGIDGKFVNNATFVGYAPHDDPRYCAVVTLERVPTGTYGGGAAGPHVARLLAEALRE